MDGTDQAASTIWYLLALVLVGSALVGMDRALSRTRRDSSAPAL